MKDFQILTDALCDLPPSWVAAHDYITIIDTPINISGDGKSLTLRHLSPDDFGQVEYYVKECKCRAMTSQPSIFDPGEDNPESVESITRKYVRTGKDVIYITMSSFLSGTYSTASICYGELAEWAEENGQHVRCVDSQCMSTGLGLLLLELAKAIENNTVKDIDDIEDFVKSERAHIGHFFTWGELSYIKLSGRVGAVRAMIGTILGVRLMCSAQYNEAHERKLEHINPHAFLRGINKFGEALGQYIRRHIDDPHGIIIVAHGNAPRDAELVTSKLRKYLPDATYLTGHDWRCSAGIQAHGGPTSLHVNFRTKDVSTLEQTTKEMESIIHNLKRI